MQNEEWRTGSVKRDVAVSEFRGATPCVLHLAQLLHLALTSLRPRPKAPEKTGALQKLRHFERPRIARQRLGLRLSFYVLLPLSGETGLDQDTASSPNFLLRLPIFVIIVYC